MREHKYKVWNRKLKEMFWFDLTWGNCGHGDGWIGMLPITEHKRTYVPDNRIQIDPDDCEILQYTSLKVKNDVEMCDGDVASGAWGNGYFGWCNECKSFEYIMSIFGCASCLGEVYWNEVVEDAPNMEIIGNIYENPELLEE